MIGSLEPSALEGPRIRLVPLATTHFEVLCAVGLDPALWARTTIRVQTRDETAAYIQTALDGAASGTAETFVIALRDTGTVVGTTRNDVRADRVSPAVARCR